MTDAAVSSAARRIPLERCEIDDADYGAERKAFVKALLPDDGTNWDRHLRDAGFAVWQAV